MSQPPQQMPQPPSLTYIDVVQAVTAALSPVQRQLETLSMTVEKLRDESSKQISRAEVDRMMSLLQTKELAEQRYGELKSTLTDLEKRIDSLETAKDSSQVRTGQNWQTAVFLVAGWLFLLLLSILMKAL